MVNRYFFHLYRFWVLIGITSLRQFHEVPRRYILMQKRFFEYSLYHDIGREVVQLYNSMLKMPNRSPEMCSNLSGPSCSKLMMSFVNDSLKFTSSDTQIC